ncbi:MAG: VWA-like domain-containing protein [candidate division WOR-3 bacterium]|uniref:Metallopeptidase domain-containing protein n=1 Tax=candidate division WOR-3 bacterium TaxID=2052148 RepID=A0A7C4W9R3_UNCW3
MDKNIEKKLRKLKVNAISLFPDVGYTFLFVKFKIDPNIPYPALTNGKEVKIHPDLFFSLFNDKEQLFIFFHELLHILLLHCYRIERRQLEIWNLAADAVVNNILKRDFGMEVPKSAITIEWLNTLFRAGIKEEDGTEVIYHKLEEKIKDKKEKEGWVYDMVKGKLFIDIEKSEKNEQDMVEIIPAILEKLVEVLRRRGKEPGSLALELERIKVKRKLPRREVAEVVKRTFGDAALSLLNPKRYYLYEEYGVFIPLYEAEEERKLILVIDSSGSTSPWWRDFFKEVFAIVAEKVKVLLIQIDAKIQSIEWLEEVPPSLVLKGGGGTDFKKFFEFQWIKKAKISYRELKKALIFFFTDLDADGVPEKPPVQINPQNFYWVLIKPKKIPWGKKIDWWLLKEERNS